MHDVEENEKILKSNHSAFIKESSILTQQFTDGKKKNKRKEKNKTQVYNSNFLLNSGYSTIKHAKKQPFILLLSIMKQQ